MGVPNWVVTDVEPRGDYSLHLTFANGEKKIYDARGLLSMPIYRQLKAMPFFMQAKASCGTVVWSDDVDIAPEHLFNESVSAD